MSDGIFGWFLGLAIGLIVFGIADSTYFDKRLVENTKKTSEVAHNKYLVNQGFGEYQLDRYTGETGFVYFSRREIVRQQFKHLSEESWRKINNGFFELTYEIKDKK